MITANSHAIEHLNFSVKNPFPVCRQELLTIDPELPLSFFDDEKKFLTKKVEISCMNELINQTHADGLNAMSEFFHKDFPKIEQEIYAKNFVQKENYKEQLKKMNDSLLSCQKRTEHLHELAALASESVYDGGVIPDGYKLEDTFTYPDSDVRIYLLTPTQTDLPPIIACAGTKSINSGLSDLSFGADQLSNSKIKFLQWVNKLSESGTKELIITGHSLGGGLAQGLAAMLPVDHKLKTHVVTFNGFGGKDAVRAYEKIHGELENKKELDKFQPLRDAISYRMENDPVSLIGRRFGEVRVIPKTHIFLRVLSNHSIQTINKDIKDTPHLLSHTKIDHDDESSGPISVAVMGISSAKAALNATGAYIAELTDKACTKPFDPNAKRLNDRCEPFANADECYQEGVKAKADNNLVLAMAKFKIGCNLCHKDACIEYAVTNKIVGNKSDTLRIAKRGCDLGDANACIEAGKLTKDKLDDYYVALGCAYGERPLCEFSSNPEFTMQYNVLKDTLCRNVKNLHSCELLYLLNLESNSNDSKRMDRIKLLISKKDSDKNSVNSSGSSLLLSATEQGNLELAKLLLNEGADPNKKNELGETPLHTAVGLGNLELTKLLLNKGAKINIENREAIAPLFYATSTKNIEITKFLLSKGANTEIVNDYGVTPLLDAVANGNFEIVKILLEHKAKLEVKDSNGNTPLLKAVADGNLEMVKLLLAGGAKPEEENAFGDRALLIAASRGNLDIVKLLLENAKLDLKNQSGDTPLLAACASGNLEMLKLFIAKGASLEVKNNTGVTPLLNASSTGNIEMVNFLLEHNANINTKDNMSITPLHNAVRSQDFAIAKLLIQKGAKIDEQDIGGSSALHLAIRNGNSEMAKLLINNNARLDMRENDDTPPLLVAVLKGNIELTNLLIDKGANIEVKENGKGNEGFNPLLQSIASGNIDLMKLLFEHGAKTDVTSTNGDTPLLLATANGDLEMVKYLVDKGLSVDVKNNTGYTPILNAASKGNLEMIKFLEKNGAPIDTVNNYNTTPLTEAASSGNLEIVKYLVERGARVQVTNKGEKTPLNFAILSGNLEMVKFLVEHKAKINQDMLKDASPEITQYLQTKTEDPFDVLNTKNKK